MLDELSFEAIFAALGAGLIVHPIAMIATAGLWMGKAQSKSLLKYFKITLVLTLITAVCAGLMYVLLEHVELRGRSARLVFGIPAFWGIAMWSYPKYALEQEEVDEFTLLVHYLAIHVGLYFLLAKLVFA